MGNKEVNPLVVIIVAVVVIVLIGYGIYHAVQPPAPARGSYTPGVPPWLEKGGQPDSGVHATPSTAPSAAK